MENTYVKLKSSKKEREKINLLLIEETKKIYNKRIELTIVSFSEIINAHKNKIDGVRFSIERNNNWEYEMQWDFNFINKSDGFDELEYHDKISKKLFENHYLDQEMLANLSFDQWLEINPLTEIVELQFAKKFFGITEGELWYKEKNAIYLSEKLEKELPVKNTIKKSKI